MRFDKDNLYEQINTILASNKSNEKLFEQVIDTISNYIDEYFGEKIRNVFENIILKYISTGIDISDQDKKNISIDNYLINFIKKSQEEIEQHYNLLPLLNSTNMERINEIKNADMNIIVKKVMKEVIEKLRETTSNNSSELNQKIYEFVEKAFEELSLFNELINYSNSIIKETENEDGSLYSEEEKEQIIHCEKVKIIKINELNENADNIKQAVLNRIINERFVRLSVSLENDSEDLCNDSILGWPIVKIIDEEANNLPITLEELIEHLENNIQWKKVKSEIPDDEFYNLIRRNFILENPKQL